MSPSQLLDTFRPISLDELNAAAGLLDRVDCKYIVSRTAFDQLVERLRGTHRVLELDGHRRFEYHTTYFDSASLDLYREHVQGRRRRFKARSRRYVESDHYVFEIKLKGLRGRTVKHQMGYAADLHGSLSPEAVAFIESQLCTAYGRELGASLAPSLHMTYRRTTLSAPELGERVTCDDTLRFFDPSGQLGAGLLDDFVIVESKSARGDALADRVLRELGARPVRNCSKYCLGIAMLRSEVPSNRQRPLLRRYFAPAGQLRPAGAFA